MLHIQYLLASSLGAYFLAFTISAIAKAPQPLVLIGRSIAADCRRCSTSNYHASVTSALEYAFTFHVAKELEDLT